MKKQNSKKILVDIDVTKAYNKLNKRKRLAYLSLCITLFVLLIIDLSTGSTDKNIFNLILTSISNLSGNEFLILTNLRLPHTICSIIAGATLGICGCLLQSSLGNPLASPSTIGISQGAACGACVAIILGESLFGQAELGPGENIIVVVFAFLFALIPCAIIFFISKLKKLSATSIILCGVAISIFFGGIVALIEYFADSTQVAEVVFWTFGSVYNTHYSGILIIFTVMIFVLIYSVFNLTNLNALECGDTTAHSIGLNVKNTRLTILVIAALGTGCVTAFCGTINFIGLIAPHIMRKFVGSNYKYLLPTSAICGACLLVLSDVLSSIILPGVILPIGAITSCIGAPIFIYVLARKKLS